MKTRLLNLLDSIGENLLRFVDAFSAAIGLVPNRPAEARARKTDVPGLARVSLVGVSKQKRKSMGKTS